MPSMNVSFQFDPLFAEVSKNAKHFLNYLKHVKYFLKFTLASSKLQDILFLIIHCSEYSILVLFVFVTSIFCTYLLLWGQERHNAFLWPEQESWKGTFKGRKNQWAGQYACLKPPPSDTEWSHTGLEGYARSHNVQAVQLIPKGSAFCQGIILVNTQILLHLSAPLTVITVHVRYCIQPSRMCVETYKSWKQWPLAIVCLFSSFPPSGSLLLSLKSPDGFCYVCCSICFI